MSQASIDAIRDTRTWEFTRNGILALGDRMFSRGISKLTTLDRRGRQDCVNASRLIVQMMLRLEAATGKTITTVRLFGDH